MSETLNLSLTKYESKETLATNQFEWKSVSSDTVVLAATHGMSEGL